MQNFSARDCYVSYHESQAEAAIRKAAELRTAGKIVELSLVPQNLEDAARISVSKNFDELIYFGEE